jgi:hypothetical protein
VHGTGTAPVSTEPMVGQHSAAGRQPAYQRQKNGLTQEPEEPVGLRGYVYA